MDAFEGCGSFGALEAATPYPGIVRQMFSSERATVSHYTFSPGASFPLHSHPQEQITLVKHGSVEVTLEDEHFTIGPGEFCVMKPGIEHSITAGEGGARIVAVIVPRREQADEYTIVEDEG